MPQERLPPTLRGKMLPTDSGLAFLWPVEYLSPLFCGNFPPFLLVEAPCTTGRKGSNC